MYLGASSGNGISTAFRSPARPEGTESNPKSIATENVKAGHKMEMIIIIKSSRGSTVCLQFHQKACKSAGQVYSEP